MVDDEFVKFVSNYNFDQKKYVKIKYFFEAYLTDIKFKKIMQNNEINKLASSNKYPIQDFKSIESEFKQIQSYCDENVLFN